MQDHKVEEERNKKMTTVGFEFFRLRRALRPHELESCPLDRSGIVAASDRNGGFQLNLYPAVLSELCPLFQLNHTRRPSQKALVIRSRYLLGEIILSKARSSVSSSLDVQHLES